MRKTLYFCFAALTNTVSSFNAETHIITARIAYDIL